MDNQQERKHHDYGPSTLQSLEACPCYQSRQTQHVRAIAGTLAHKVVESGQDDDRLLDEDAEAAAECADFTESRRQWISEQHNGEPTELKEAYLPIDDCVFDDPTELDGKQGTRRVVATTAGYVDQVFISKDETYAEIIDYKFGLWPVEKADNNLQGIAYALGLFKKYRNLHSIQFWFLQPHIDFTSVAFFTRAQVEQLYLRVQVVVARAREARKKMLLGDFSMATPAIPACNFCANLGRCSKVTEIACKVGSKFYPLEIPETITPTAVQDPHQTSLGMKLAGVMKVWSDAFRRQTADRVLRGKADMPIGFKMEQRQGDREVVNMEAYKQAARRYLTDEEIELCSSVSLTAVEEKISEKSPRGQKEATVKQFKKELEDAGVTKRGEPYCFLKVDNSADKSNQ